MEITLQLDGDLLADAKKLAIDTGRKFTQVLEDSLRVALAESRAKKGSKPIILHTFHGNGLQPGVDLSSNSALLDLMDEYDGYTGR